MFMLEFSFADFCLCCLAIGVCAYVFLYVGAYACRYVCACVCACVPVSLCVLVWMCMFVQYIPVHLRFPVKTGI